MTLPVRHSAAVIISMALAVGSAASSENDAVRGAPTDMLASETASETSKAQQPAARQRRDKLPIQAFSGSAGLILTQTDHVRISCFPERLKAVLMDVSHHFGRPVVITSGFRGGGRKGSYHRKCLAADIQIAGVAPSAVVRYARAHQDVGGVGSYGHTRSVHVDVGERVFSWFGGRRRTAMSGVSGCCPECAAVAAKAGGKSRFEAACTS